MEKVKAEKGKRYSAARLRIEDLIVGEHFNLVTPKYEGEGKVWSEIVGEIDEGFTCYAIRLSDTKYCLMPYKSMMPKDAGEYLEYN